MPFTAWKHEERNRHTSRQMYLLKLQGVAYSHLSNKRGGWNKRGGGAKNTKSRNVEVGIIVEAGIFL